MKKVLSLALVAVLMSAGAVYAEGLGVFNAQTVAMQSDPAKAAQKLMEGQFGAEKTQLEKQAQDLQKQGESLQAQAAAMSQKAREEKQMDFMRKRRDFEEKSRNFAMRVQQEESRITQNMGKFIFDAAAVVAKKRDLDLVLDASTGSVMFAAPSLDLTQDMLDEVNRQWKAAGSKFQNVTAPAGKK